MAGKFYAVKVGKTPGIYNTWDDCKAQVDGVSGAAYKSFKTAGEAAEYMGWSGGVSQTAYEEEIRGQNTFADKKMQQEQNATVSCNHEQDQPPYDGIAYVDGSYNVATGEFSYGVVMFHDGKELHFNRKFNDASLAEMRNVAGEIKGAEAAMEYAVDNGMKKLSIYHDYEGIAKWPLRQWKANKEGTKAYQAFYDSIAKNVEVTFIKVKGHSGDKYNDEADRLAKEALGI